MTTLDTAISCTLARHVVRSLDLTIPADQVLLIPLGDDLLTQGGRTCSADLFPGPCIVPERPPI